MARKDITLDFGPNNSVEKEIGTGKERKKGDRKEKVEREALPSLLFFRRSDHWFLSEQEGKLFFAARASSRDR